MMLLRYQDYLQQVLDHPRILKMRKQGALYQLQWVPRQLSQNVVPPLRVHIPGESRSFPPSGPTNYWLCSACTTLASFLPPLSLAPEHLCPAAHHSKSRRDVLLPTRYGHYPPSPSSPASGSSASAPPPFPVDRVQTSPFPVDRSNRVQAPVLPPSSRFSARITPTGEEDLHSRAAASLPSPR
jgi:hypothetical protein